MIPKKSGGKWRGRQRRAEKKYDEAEREQFRKAMPHAFAQSQTIAQLVKHSIKPWRQWRRTKKTRLTAKAALEKFMLDTAATKMDSRKFRALLNRLQSQGIKAIEKEQYFFEVREILMKHIMGITDFYAQQRAFELEYDKTAIQIENKFYGNIKMLADTRLLKSFAELVTRMNISEDETYKSLRLRIAEFIKVLERDARNSDETLGALRYGYDFGHISKAKYEAAVLAEQLVEIQHQKKLAEYTESLYRHLHWYAKEERLGRFLAMLARERMVEKKHFIRRERKLERTIRRMKTD